MEARLNYEIHDNLIPLVLRREVWFYIHGLEYYAMLKDQPVAEDRNVIYYTPRENKKEYYNKSLDAWNNQFMHRTCFGNNEEEIKKHPPIEKLWNAINSQFDNKFEIAGDKEDCHSKETGKILYQRSYVNIQPKEEIKRSHGVHRDTANISETKNFTLLYIPNLEWYPTWFGELMFYENDDSSKDKQQWQKNYAQSKGFGIGQVFATIPTVPGRIVVWDGRMLHTTRPVAQWAQELRYSLIFRVRLKEENNGNTI